MGKLKIEKTNVEHFGSCVEINNGLIKLVVTTDFGPRIIHFSVVGMENMLFNDHEKKPFGDVMPEYDGDVMRFYGGHRLWVSPEIMPRCYYPDNAQVAWKQTQDGVEFTASVEKYNNIQKTISVVMDENSPGVTVKHWITNLGAWDIVLAPSSVTMTAKGGVEVLPMGNNKTGFLPNRNISLWDYSDMNDPRVYWGSDFIVLKQNEAINNPFKMGYNNQEGWGARFNKDQLFIVSFSPVKDGVYPDCGCCYETYVNGEMLEMETLGTIAKVAPKEKVYFEEKWQIFKQQAPKGDGSELEMEISNIMDNYIRTVS